MTETEQTTSQDDPGRALTGRQIAQAASLIMAALILSGILGLIRQVAISAAFGAGRDLDAFYAALRLPETLFVLVAGGALGSAFIPVFARFLARDDFAGAWRLASATLTLVTLTGTFISGVCFVFALPIVETFLIPNADTASQYLTAELMRIMLVTVIIFGASGLVMGILNGYQRFLAPALAPSLYNVGLIFGAVGLAPEFGVHGLAWGAVIGAVLHLLVQIPVLVRLDYFHLRPDPNPRVLGVVEVLTLMAPRVLGLGIVQVNFWVNAALTSGMMEGSLTALTTAFTLMFTVLGILGQSVGTAVFPTLSRLYAENKQEDFGRTLMGALSSVLFLSIPSGLGLAVLANPIITVLFERGEWSSTDTAGTAWALALFSVGLVGHAVLEILARAFYALHDTATPVKVGFLTMLLNIIMSLIFIRLLGYPDDDNFARGAFGGLALSMTIATGIESTLLWILLRRRIRLDDRPVLMGAGRVLVAGLLMVGAVMGWRGLAGDMSALVVLIVGMGLGVGVFWIAALLLRVGEARAVPQMFLARFR
jgi:putative peptidoglycan lipid II flippase